jgi:hypothetical protein
MIISTKYREKAGCKCGCGYNCVDADIAYLLDVLNVGGIEYDINSWCRCKEHNKKEGGADKSYHLLGLAVDIAPKNKTPLQIYNMLCSWFKDSCGIILYDWGVHFDLRKNFYRDDRRTKKE